MSFDIKINWSTPKRTTDEDSAVCWEREWTIPDHYTSGFFAFWKKRGLSLKIRGYRVTKRNNKWILIQSASSIAEFDAPAKPTADVENFELVPIDVRHTDGLYPWQVTAVGKLCAAINKWGNAIDGSDMGIGKTFSACGVARELDMNILVVCPKSVMESWRRVIRDHFKMQDRLVGIINYESLRIGKTSSNIASFVKKRSTRRQEFTWKIPKDTLIVWDESQKLKNSKTKNSETCIAALKQGYKMLFCSATNACNPLELRTVGMALKLFSNSKQYYAWLYNHGVTKGRFGFEFNGDKDVLKKLHRDIFINRGVRLNRDTIPNFPDTQITAECFDLDDDATSKISDIYKEMKRELETLARKVDRSEKKDGAINRLTAILRAREKVELLKIPIFTELIEESLEAGMSVVVFLNFSASIKALAERFNTSCIIDGSNKEADRIKYIDNFQSDKERLIIVNIQSGGAGLSLHDKNGNFPRISLISPCFSAVLMRQATGRVWRDGSKTKSIQKIVFVSKTVEEDVCTKVKIKLNNLDTLNDGDLQNDENEM